MNTSKVFIVSLLLLVVGFSFVSAVSEQQRLIDMVNSYRQQNGRSVVPSSYWLTATGMLHTIDRSLNGQPSGCTSGHSWSPASSQWLGCCYNSTLWQCMCKKPDEISGSKFTGISYENWVGAPSAEVALEAWKNSPSHNSVILNLDGWAGTPWNSIGAGVCGGYYSLWFSSAADPTPASYIDTLTCSMNINAKVPDPLSQASKLPAASQAAPLASRSPSFSASRSVVPASRAPSVTPSRSSGPTVTPPKMWMGSLSVGASWQTVSMSQNFVKPVVSCSIYYTGSTPMVVRVRNVVDGQNTFQVSVVGVPGTVSQFVPVDCIVVEAGIYTVQANGIKMEANRITSAITNNIRNWVDGFRLTFTNAYTTPIVLGQVMSSNDVNWSVFFARGAVSPASPISGSSCFIGKHVGEDPTSTRASETLGYIVIDAGTGTWNGKKYQAMKAQSIGGFDTSAPYSTPVSSTLVPKFGVTSINTMAGADGAWSIFYGNKATAFANQRVALSLDEDNYVDPERSHSFEEVGVLLFE